MANSRRIPNALACQSPSPWPWWSLARPFHVCSQCWKRCTEPHRHEFFKKGRRLYFLLDPRSNSYKHNQNGEQANQEASNICVWWMSWHISELAPINRENRQTQNNHQQHHHKIDLGPAPVTEEALFAWPYKYIPFFFKILKFFETSTCSAREPSAMTSLPLSWIKCKIATKIQEQRNTSKTAQRRLVAAVRWCIIQHTRDPLLEPTIKDLVKSHDCILHLIMKTCWKIQVNTFCPKMYITTKNTQLFTMCPLYSY